MLRPLVMCALLALCACSEGETAIEAKNDESQIGASSGPNPNFDGAAAADVFDEPTHDNDADAASAPVADDRTSATAN